jgi:hypothetical protein
MVCMITCTSQESGRGLDCDEIKDTEFDIYESKERILSKDVKLIS